MSFFHFFINLSVYFNFCIHSLVFLSFLIDSQGLLLSVLSQFCLILSVFTPNERHPLTGFWPFRSERSFGVSTSLRCKAPPNGFLTVSQWEAFWVFDIVSLRVRRFGFLTSFHQMRAFYVFEVFVVFTQLRVYLTLSSILYPFEFLRSFAVLDYYVYNWSSTSILYPFEVLRSFEAFRPLWVLTFFEYLISFWVVDVVCGV